LNYKEIEYKVFLFNMMYF